MFKFYSIVDRASEHPELNANGGDYDFGRTIAVDDGTPTGVRYWTSADFDFCPHRGTFDRCEENCDYRRASIGEADGWERGTLLVGEDRDSADNRWRQGGFAEIAS